jgi:succinate-semialdehyde dehydrogenase/glutarate-semialdehyde dehydrogenase
VLEAAQKGFEVWRNTPAYERAKVLRKAAALVRERADTIGRIMTQEQGKVLAEARLEVLVTADIIEWYAEEGRRSYGRIVQGRQKHVRQMVMQEPVGVVAAFTPWNFPTLTPIRKIAGALAAGCSIIIKASEETPGGCVELVKCFADAGLPAGVLNLVFGVPANVSEHLIPSNIVRKISFTGSIPVGKHLAGLAAKGMKRATMELGTSGRRFDDADRKKPPIPSPRSNTATPARCISPTRFYVRSWSTTASQALHRLCQCDRLRWPPDGTTMGRWRTAPARRASFVNDAKNRGGKVVTGGNRSGNQGFFFEPTVVTDVPDDSKIMTEEPFGPVAPIVRFKTFDEVVQRANSLEFGLAAYTFTSSPKTATAIGDALQSGMVGVNSVAISTPETPFGGIKDSGYGHEGGIEGWKPKHGKLSRR